MQRKLTRTGSIGVSVDGQSRSEETYGRGCKMVEVDEDGEGRGKDQNKEMNRE